MTENPPSRSSEREPSRALSGAEDGRPVPSDPHPRRPQPARVAGDDADGCESGGSCTGRCGRQAASLEPGHAHDGSPTGIDLGEVDTMVARIGREPQHLIPLLQAIQTRWNWLPPTALERLCEVTEIAPEAVTGVSTFYSQFRHHPVGRHIVRTCVGTACHVSGAEWVHDALRKHLGHAPGEATDPGGEFTVEPVACLGCCMLAPVVQIDQTMYGGVQPWRVPALVQDFRASAGKGHGREGSAGDVAEAIGEVRLCLCSSCVAGGARPVYEELARQIAALGLPARLKEVGCTGVSFETPLLEMALYQGPKFRYGRVAVADVRDLLLRHFRPATRWRRFKARVFHALQTLLTDDAWEPPTRYAQDVRAGIEAAFEGPQTRWVTEHAGVLDPASLDDYLARDGFRALERCLQERTPEEVIAEVQSSGLRGRGGAGFPTGQKWAATRASAGAVKHVICNGDEGDPGAFMDRMILESFPFRVIEGMAIGAYAVGAHEGFFYIRAEYPLATRRIRDAIDCCERRGLLGSSVMGSGFALKLSVVEGAGAFVCGEETALMSVIEGGRGMPRFRPPFPAQAGLWGRPTCINNVETFASVPWILRHGAREYAAVGTERSKGTKTFALAGKIRRGGLIETPMGMTIDRIVNEIGGGVPEGRKLKAVLMGGPSGGCVPAHLAGTPVDYEALREVGAIMGSGGMVVLDDTDCMVDVARYFLTFTQDESCGKCTHCRVGTKRMKEVLDRLCCGRGRPDDLRTLETLATITIQGSLCGLGKTAPNPVLSSLRYFRDEYEAHARGVCPARKCKPLIQYHVTDTCIGCTRCAQSCPSDSIPLTPYRRHSIEVASCIRCDICRQVCPTNAIEIVPRNKGAVHANARTN